MATEPTEQDAIELLLKAGYGIVIPVQVLRRGKLMSEPTEQDREQAQAILYAAMEGSRWGVVYDTELVADLIQRFATALHEREEQTWKRVMEIANATKADELWYALEQSAAQPKG